MTNRRDFLKGACAVGACMAGAKAALAESVGAAKLKIGVLSDIHLEGPASVEKLEKALVCYRDRRVDGVLICGDLADHGILPELKMLADTWRKVFPDDRLPDGSHVERLFHYGDHDTGGYAHTKGFFHSGDRLMKKYGVSYDELCSWAIRPQLAKAWETVFGEKYEPIFRKTVKGYDFVLANLTFENSNGGNRTPGLEAFFESYRPDPTKPFFHSQHRVYRRTAGGPATWGQDDGSTGRILSRYPNCLAFCGHGHLSATDEKAIWQGAYSAIEVPSLRYVGFAGDHENKSVSALRQKAGIPAQMGSLSVYESLQGLLMTVCEREIVIDRIDFGATEPLGPAWRIPLDPTRRPYAPSERRRTEVAPQFPAGAVVKVAEKKGKNKDGSEKRQLEVTFPLAQPTGMTPRAFDYEVTAVALQTGGPATPVVHKVYSPRAFDAPSRDPGPGRCLFSFAEFPEKSRTFYVEVTPLAAYGRRGEPIGVEFDVRLGKE